MTAQHLSLSSDEKGQQLIQEGTDLLLIHDRADFGRSANGYIQLPG